MGSLENERSGNNSHNLRDEKNYLKANARQYDKFQNKISNYFEVTPIFRTNIEQLQYPQAALTDGLQDNCWNSLCNTEPTEQLAMIRGDRLYDPKKWPRAGPFKVVRNQQQQLEAESEDQKKNLSEMI